VDKFFPLCVKKSPKLFPLRAKKRPYFSIAWKILKLFFHCVEKSGLFFHCGKIWIVGETLPA